MVPAPNAGYGIDRPAYRPNHGADFIGGNWGSNRPTGNRPGYQRPTPLTDRWPGNEYHFRFHDHHHHHHYDWHHGYWNWNYRPIPWSGYATTSWATSPIESYVFTNPFYVPPANLPYAGLNYSRPIVVPAQPDTSQLGASRAAAVLRRMTQARSSFRRGEYPRALDNVERAIELSPDDRTLHEFRGLTLFALGEYNTAAGVIYSVLAGGPGWDVQTLEKLYPNRELYQQQLAALSDYVERQPRDARARFLLAYHYLTLGYAEEALTQLRLVRRLMPNDPLTAALIDSIAGGFPQPR